MGVSGREMSSEARPQLTRERKRVELKRQCGWQIAATGHETADQQHHATRTRLDTTQIR